MITFEQAREAVTAAIAPTWDETLGPLYVAPYGYEDAEGYQIPYGSPLAPLDLQSALPVELQGTDQPLAIVSKADGSVDLEPWLVVADRVDAMDPVNPELAGVDLP